MHVFLANANAVPLPFFAAFARRHGPVLLAFSLCALSMGGPLAAGAAAQPAPSDTAQSFGRAFETMALSAGGSANFNTGLFDEFYRSSPGAHVAFSTPFYAGTAEAEVGLRRYETHLDSAENFWAVPLTLSWGWRPRLSPRLSVEAAGRVGMLVMDFSGAAAGLGIENELLLGLGGGLSFRFAEGWRLVAAGRYERVYLNPSIGLWHVSLGLRRTFRMPEWLQNVLR